MSVTASSGDCFVTTTDSNRVSLQPLSSFRALRVTSICSTLVKKYYRKRYAKNCFEFVRISLGNIYYSTSDTCLCARYCEHFALSWSCRFRKGLFWGQLCGSRQKKRATKRSQRQAESPPRGPFSRGLRSCGVQSPLQMSTGIT